MTCRNCRDQICQNRCVAQDVDFVTTKGSSIAYLKEVREIARERLANGMYMCISLDSYSDEELGKFFTDHGCTTLEGALKLLKMT